MSRTIGLTIAVVCALVLGRAHADEGWSATFTPQSAAAIETPLRSVVVVPAGADDERGPAADALLAGLRASGRASSVMNASALGDVSSHDDWEIVQFARDLPVNTIAIVRSSTEADGRTSAVVSYDKTGRPLVVLSGDKGAAAVASAPRSRDRVVSPSFTAPVTFTSTSAKIPLEVRARTPAYSRRGRYLGDDCTTLLCTTPCTLALHPQQLDFCVTGNAVSQYQATLHVSQDGADVRLRASTNRGFLSGLFLTVLGSTGIFAGSITLGLWDANSALHERSVLIGGAATLGVSAAMAIAGVTLTVVNRHEISVRPRATTPAEVSLTNGPGGVRGTF